MTQPLEGRVVALAEGRQLEDLVGMLEAAGAFALRYPMVGILDAPDEGPVLDWLRELCAGRLDWVVLMTGEGVRRLLGFAERAAMRHDVIAALSRVPTLTRGPKPGQALKEIGLSPALVAPMPTTEGVLTALRRENLDGLTVGITLAGMPNPVLEAGLATLGARVRPVLPYVYAAAADDERILDLVSRLSRGEVDVVVFTSAPQVDRLFEVATSHRRDADLRKGLGRTRVAAVGPVVAETIRRYGGEVHICPEQGFVMKNLVQQIKRSFGA
jgi:uroporphyrinogen-III synthase